MGALGLVGDLLVERQTFWLAGVLVVERQVQLLVCPARTGVSFAKNLAKEEI